MESKESAKIFIGSIISLLLSVVSFFLVQINNQFQDSIKVLHKLDKKIEVLDVESKMERSSLRKEVDSNTKAIKTLQDGRLPKHNYIYSNE